ncbi:MAG: hypothetical protein ACLQGP_19605 [Isosphaeraceae bacterium]
MANLTVAEKSHWRDRIQARIDRRIEAITAGDPGLMDRIRREARGQALASLGLADFQAELDQIVEQKDALDKRERQARRAMLARIRGVAVEDVEARYYGSLDPEVGTAIGKRQVVHEEELLAEHELGRRVLELRAQKENLLDVVWLATSPAQVRELWTRIGKLLGDEPTALEREALAIPPAGEEV